MALDLSSDGQSLVTASRVVGKSGGTDVLYASSDAGASWTELSPIAAIFPWAKGTPALSSDGGKEWVRLPNAGDEWWYDVWMSQDGRRLILGGAGLARVSDDGGETWHELTWPEHDTVSPFSVVSASEDGRVIGAGSDGKIWLSHDGGQTRRWPRRSDHGPQRPGGMRSATGGWTNLDRISGIVTFTPRGPVIAAAFVSDAVVI